MIAISFYSAGKYWAKVFEGDKLIDQLCAATMAELAKKVKAAYHIKLD